MYTEAPGTNYTLDFILGEVSWYWHTQSYSRGLWAYRAVWEPVLKSANLDKLPNPLEIQDKPLGFSWFPHDVITAVRSWLEHWFPNNLVFYRAHKSVSFSFFSLSPSLSFFFLFLLSFGRGVTNRYL